MLAFTGMAALQTAVVLVLANAVDGGLVAFQLALSLFSLPIAVVVWPVARALIPQLARRSRLDDGAFAGEVRRATGLVTFVTAPTAVAYVVLAAPIGRAIAFGAFETGDGARLVAVALGAWASASWPKGGSCSRPVPSMRSATCARPCARCSFA